MTYRLRFTHTLFLSVLTVAGAAAADPIEPDEHVLEPGSADPAQVGGDESSDGVLEPSTRPFFVNFAIGPSIGMVGCSNGHCDSADAVNQIKLSQEFGYHFWGEGEGPALGFSIDEAFGDHVTRVQPGAKFWWDIQPADDLGLYIAPFVKVGYGWAKLDAGPFGSADDSYFNAQTGVEARIVLVDRVLLYLRPVGIDILANEDGALMMYDIMVSGGVTF